MNRCLELALLGSGHVAPNPLVGALLVHDGKIIGEGYHAFYGGPHAEVNCLASVPGEKRELIPRSTLFVSLEPCNHFGKTPPCTELIIENKIPEVVIGCIDQNSLVSGKGVQRLKDAGVSVITGILENECTALNKRFFTTQNKKRPYVILKWAQTTNGVIGSRENRIHISNAYTNTLVQRWRSEEQSILVGCGTALADDPLLTNRFGSGRQPIRVLLCEQPPEKNLKMFSEPGNTIVFNKNRDGKSENVTWIKIVGDQYLNEVMSILYEMAIQSILVEGGAYTLKRFFEAGLWDECRIITNTQMFASGEIKAPQLPQVKLSGTQTILDDRIQYFANPDNNFVASIKLSDYF